MHVRFGNPSRNEPACRFVWKSPWTIQPAGSPPGRSADRMGFWVRSLLTPKAGAALAPGALGSLGPKGLGQAWPQRGFPEGILQELERRAGPRGLQWVR